MIQLASATRSPTDKIYPSFDDIVFIERGIGMMVAKSCRLRLIR